MALRLVEVVVPHDRVSYVRERLVDRPTLGVWELNLGEEFSLVRILLDAEATDAVLDELQELFSFTEGYRICLLPVEATLPRVEVEKKSESAVSDESDKKAGPQQKAGRIGREELYHDVIDSSRVSRVFLVMAALSTIVAANGLMTDSVAVIIGAMVIAPLLGPNVAQSLGIALGDLALVRRALRANLAGLGTAFIISVCIGLTFHVDSTTQEISSRTDVEPGDVVLALASGVAGALAFTTGLSATLIGVMVAVALLPPLATFGILLGDGQPREAFNALILLLVNLIAVNFAGVITFLVQGIRPANWWEAKKARSATLFAIIFWSALLLLALGAVFLTQSIN